jgi:phosphoribosylamine--glycine ligase / phosphoribosylformylglycinamidine cyclo-ligase
MAKLFDQPLRILLIGNGGREHALAWKLSQSSRVETILAVPGNGGTALCPKVTNVEAVSPDDFPALVEFAKANRVNLAVPGPEAPLVAGVQDHFEDAGISCFGPCKKAAQLEGSKTFAKDFMKKYGIPTAAYENFSAYDDAARYLDTISHRVVVKATGLAAGKGVIMPETTEEAKAAVKQIMLDKEFGDAGNEVVIEEFLEGQELSILTFSDGKDFKSLPMAQDHKRIFDGDQGPNTGGMGCYAPTPISTEDLIKTVDRDILEPTFRGMRSENSAFVGCLFTGLMITKNGPKVLEYNVRFGDPETQTVLPLLSRDSDLAEIMIKCLARNLDTAKLEIERRFSSTVVVAAGGYPGSYAKGTPISVQETPEDIAIFHAGTKLDGGQLRTNGGRVIAANAVASSLEEAVEKAYAGVGLIKFDNMFFRKDIAHRALGRKPQSGAEQEGLTYAQSGVSIDAGNDLVQRIKKTVASTKITGSDGEIGGFGGELSLGPHAKCSGCAKPYDVSIVAAIDGVGTKLLVAQAVGKHDTVGIDLVAMNVNDLLVQGAVPLIFLDYFACGKLNVAMAADFVDGVAAGCRQARSVLVGGETAEMPGLYQGTHYDAAGCSIGILMPDHRLPRTDLMLEGDILLGVASSGVHSNGYSLVRRVLATTGANFDILVNEPAPWNPSTSVGESLLTPTRIYTSILDLTRKMLVKGLAHITGGGLVENPPRMLPRHLAAEIDLSTWERPAVFKWLQETGRITDREMCKTFNNGIGMVAVVAPDKADEALAILKAAGEAVYKIGRLAARSPSAEGSVLLNTFR